MGRAPRRAGRRARVPGAARRAPADRRDQPPKSTGS
jgi:hypothetical protein